ncbi:hypothetical protein LCGC14_3020690, partial [marine sediment metagenome]
GHLRTYQTGKHGSLSQKLLNEVAAARVCLLNPHKRAAYDERLRQQATVAEDAPATTTTEHAPRDLLVQVDPERAAKSYRPSARRRRRLSPALLGSAIASILLTAIGVVLILPRQPVDQPGMNPQTARRRPGTSTTSKRPVKVLSEVVRDGSAPAPEVATDNGSSEIASFGGTNAVDLLCRIDPVKDRGFGKWTRDDKVLVSPSEHCAWLRIPYAVSAEYDLKVVAERRSRGGLLSVRLVSSGKPFAVFAEPTKIAVARIDGKWREFPHEPSVFQDKTITVVFRVRRSGFQVLGNGKLLVDWQGDSSRLSHPRWAAGTNDLQLGLVTWDGVFAIQEITLTPGSAPEPQPTGGPPS